MVIERSFWDLFYFIIFPPLPNINTIIKGNNNGAFKKCVNM